MISQFLDLPIAFHRSLVGIGAGVTGALMLSQAVYWSNRTTLDGGWFYKTQAQWEEETGLTRYEQEGARKKLKSLGILEEMKCGVPCKTHYRVNFSVLDNCLIQYAENQQTRMQKTSKQGSGKPANSAVENQQTITETTQRLHKDYNNDLGDSDESKSQAVEKLVDEQPVKKKKTRSTQLPDDFIPSHQHYELANELSVNLDREFSQFCDYHKAKGSTFKDWHAALRTWIRNSAKFAKGKAPKNNKGYFRQDSAGQDYWDGVDKNGKF